MSAMIDSLNDDGGVSPCRKHPIRLADFMARYGPDQGYAVVIDATDSLSLQPGLLRLYEQVIASGQTPEALGLPPLTGDCTMVFRARLEDSQGRVLATASAVKPVMQYKDFEAGETAARQRLLAVLGFGDEVLDADAAADPVDQRRVKAEYPCVMDNAESKSVPSDFRVEIGAGESAPASTPEAEAEQIASAGDTVPPALVRQIAHLAKIKNRDVPRYGTVQEAREALKRLIAT